MSHMTLASTTLILLLTACAGTDLPGEGTDPAASQPGSTGSPGSTGPTDGGTIHQVDQAMLDALIEQASQESGVAAEEVEVVAAEAVTWSDGSLGCPQEGMAYTQALVPGFRVMLEVGGERIQYHAGSDGEFFSCDDPQEPVDSGTVDH